MPINADQPLEEITIADATIGIDTLIPTSQKNSTTQIYETLNVSMFGLAAFLHDSAETARQAPNPTPGNLLVVDAAGLGDPVDSGFAPTSNFNLSNANELPNAPSIGAYIAAAISNAVGAQNQKDAVGAADITTDVSITSAPASIGGVSMSGAASKRVFLGGKTSAALNGIYLWVAAGSPMARTTDADAWSELPNAIFTVLAGTHAGKQYRITNGATGTLGTTAITYKEDTSPVVSDANLSWVSTSGNDGGTGAITNPYRTTTAAQGRPGIAAPHVFAHLGQTFSGWTQSLTNMTYTVFDPLTSSGKTVINSQITFPAGKQYGALVGFTFTADTAISIASGNLGGNKIERCTWNGGFGVTTLMSIGSTAISYISIRKSDATGSPLAVLPLPDFASSYTVAFAEMATRFPVTSVGANGSPTCIITIEASCVEGSVRVFPAFKGLVYWGNSSFAAPITEVITTQTRLTALLADTSGTDAVARYYLINFASPSLFAQGAIFGKQSASGQTEHFWARTYDQAGTAGIYCLADGKTYNKAGNSTWVQADAGTIPAGSIGSTELASTAVMPGTYGDATKAVTLTVDQDGRITAASETAITNTGTVAVAQYAKYSCPDLTVQTLSAYYPVKFTRQDLVLGTAITVNAAGDQITFQPGYTYRIRGSHGLGAGAGAYIQSRWYDAYAGNFVGNKAGVASPISSNPLGYNQAIAEHTFTPTSAMVMQLRIDYYDNATKIGYDTNAGTDQQPWFEAEAIAAPAVVPTAAAVSPKVTVLKSGSGTFNRDLSASYLKVKAVAAGAGGGGGGSNTGGSSNNASNGGNTVFGALTLTGGQAAYAGNNAFSLPSGMVGLTIAGGAGVFGSWTSASTGANGGTGAGTPFASGGGGGTAGFGFGVIQPNTGVGGGGGGVYPSVAQAYGGMGGGSGDYAEFVIASPLTSYAYSIGAGGAGGNPGTSGNGGGAGSSGIIIIEEFY